MSRKIFNVVVDKISLLFWMNPAVPNAETKRSLLKMQAPKKISAELQERLAVIIEKNSQ